MGLAGPRIKQRISADPNNLHWSNDQSKFGFRMLMKMGWAPGKGLGVNEDGQQEHVKVRIKDDTLGLGASKKNVDNWLDNTDAFSRLLADLNSRTEETAKRKHEDDAEDEPKEKKKKEKKSKEDKKDKEEKKKKKKEKKDKKDKKEKKKKKDKKKEESSSSSSNDEGRSSKNDMEKAKIVLRNAARAKFLRAKKLATTQDKARLNEILGIKPTVSA